MAKDKEESNVHAKTFEAVGQQLSLEGTSGPSKLKQETAKGKPVFHTLILSGQNLSLRGTSGPSGHPQYVAQGQPVFYGATMSGARPSVSQSSVDRGQPSVIRGVAGLYPRTMNK